MIFEDVKEILADQLDIKDKNIITMDTDLEKDLGADSLDSIDIVMTIEDKYDIEVPDEIITCMKTVGDIVSYIESHT